MIELGEAGRGPRCARRRAPGRPEVTDRPSLVVVLRTHIAFPSPTHLDDPAAHGLAFSAEDIAETKAVMGLPPDEDFYVPDDVLAMYRDAGRRGRRRARPGRRSSTTHSASGATNGSRRSAGVRCRDGTEVAAQLGAGREARHPRGVDEVPVRGHGPGARPGRRVGADLTGNTGTKLDGADALLTVDRPGGRQIHFGIREHAMGSTMNGMALHGGLLPVGGTFLVFSRLHAAGRAPRRADRGRRSIFAW